MTTDLDVNLTQAMPLHNQMAATCILGCCSKYLFAVLLKSHITTHLPDRNSQKPPRFLFERAVLARLYKTAEPDVRRSEGDASRGLRSVSLFDL